MLRERETDLNRDTGVTKLKTCSGGAPNIYLTSYFLNPKPNPYPFLDPGRVIPGNAGGPGPGRRVGSQNPNPLGSCAPPDPRSGFFGAVRGPASYLFIVLFYYSSSSVIFFNIRLYQFSGPSSMACRMCMMLIVERETMIVKEDWRKLRGRDICWGQGCTS